jgi:hypothetical protein
MRIAPHISRIFVALSRTVPAQPSARSRLVRFPEEARAQDWCGFQKAYWCPESMIGGRAGRAAFTQATGDIVTPGHSAKGKSVGAPMASRATSNSENLSNRRTPKQVATTRVVTKG